MAYKKTIWESREGSNLNRFEKDQETARSVILRNAPNNVTRHGTKFSVSNMNNIENGIFDAHGMIAAEELQRKASDGNLQTALLNETAGRTNAIQAHNESTTAHPEIRSIINSLIGLPVWDDSTHTIIFTAKDGSTLEVDLPLEDLARDIGFDPEAKEIIIFKHDGTEIRIDVGDLVDVYTGSLGTHIQITVGDDNRIKAVLRGGSITETELSAALLAKIDGKLDAAAQAADSAKLGGRLPGVYAKQTDMEAADQHLQNQITALTPGEMVPVNHASEQPVFGAADTGVYGHAVFPPDEPAADNLYTIPYKYINGGSINLNNFRSPGIYTLYNPSSTSNFPVFTSESSTTGSTVPWGSGENASAILEVHSFFGTTLVKQKLYRIGSNASYERYSASETAWSSWDDTDKHPIGSSYEQKPNDFTPAERRFTGSWVLWNRRAELYELITNDEYNALFSSTPAAWTASASIANNAYRIWCLDEVSNAGTRRIIRANKAVTSTRPKAMNPLDFNDLPNIKIAARRAAQPSWTASDLSIGATVASVVIDGVTYTNMRVVGILTFSGLYPSYAGGNRPAFVSGGLDHDVTRKVAGTVGMGYSTQEATPPFFNESVSNSFGGSGFYWTRIKYDNSLSTPTGNENSPRTMSVQYWRRVS